MEIIDKSPVVIKVHFNNNTYILGDYNEGVLKDCQLTDNVIPYIHSYC